MVSRGVPAGNSAVPPSGVCTMIGWPFGRTPIWPAISSTVWFCISGDICMNSLPTFTRCPPMLMVTWPPDCGVSN